MEKLVQFHRLNFPPGGISKTYFFPIHKLRPAQWLLSNLDNLSLNLRKERKQGKLVISRRAKAKRGFKVSRYL